MPKEVRLSRCRLVLLAVLGLMAACSAGARVGGNAPAAPSGRKQPRAPRSRRRSPPKDLESNPAPHLLSGAIAGAVSNTVVAPLDILRLNLIVSSEAQTPIQVARRIFARGGVLGFWHGNTADVVRTIPTSAIRFYSFALYKSRLGQALPDLPPAAVSVIAGGAAGMTAMATCFPLETVRTRMATVGAARGLSLFGYMRYLIQTEGVKALYSGITPSLISVVPYFAVRLGTYDILLRWSRRSLPSGDGTAGVPPSVTAACGMVAGLAAQTTTFPFELVRRRAMVGQSEINPIRAMRRIARQEGFARGLYKGYGLSLVKVVPSSAVTFMVYEASYSFLSGLLLRPPDSGRG